MILSEPKVFFLGETAVDAGNVQAWLNEIGGEEAEKSFTKSSGSDIERLVEMGARRCYKSFAPGLNPNVTRIRSESRAYHYNILNQRHGSVMAHGHVTFAFENVSRVFTHELVRNSTGNDFSQESLRYVRLENMRFWIPSIITKETELRPVTPPPSGVTDIFKPGDKVHMTPTQIFNEVIEMSEWSQKALAEYFDIDGIKDFGLKKLLTSAFRRVALEGLGTGIVVTFNMRSLRWVIEQRTSRHAEEEIRLVFNEVAQIALSHWPFLFQDFQTIDTGDGLLEYVPGNSKV